DRAGAVRSRREEMTPRQPCLKRACNTVTAPRGRPSSRRPSIGSHSALLSATSSTTTGSTGGARSSTSSATCGCISRLFSAGAVWPLITTAEVRRYVVRRQDEGAKNATINRELSVLKRAFNLAIAEGTLASGPHIPLLREDNVRRASLRSTNS